MSRLQSLKVFIKQRLSAAVEDIFGHLDKTISEYEEELELRLSTKLLDEASQPGEKPQEAVCHPADIQQLLVSRDVQDIKEEQEEVWTSQEGEQLRGLEEADITKFTFTPVHVKSEEDDEDDAGHMKTAVDGEDCGGSETARNSDPNRHLQPESFVKTSHFSEAETADCSYYWMGPRPDLNALNSHIVPINDIGAKSHRCSECGRMFAKKATLRRHMRSHTGERPFGCTICGKRFTQSGPLVHHLRIHTGEKPFSCSFCGKKFPQKGNLTSHMTVHTGEKPFSCTVCGRQFTRQARVKNHKCVVETSGSQEQML